jgi:transmembrane protease serine 3
MSKFTLLFVAGAALIAVASAQCGTSSASMRANRPHADGQRIVGGVEARKGSHPWIVSLQQGSHFCGGSLVGVPGSKTQSDIVITAAHCVPPGTSVRGMTVSAGAHIISRPSSTQQTVSISKAVPHENYNEETTLNDIAILKLSSPIKFSTGVQPVCLPAKGEQAAGEGTVAGWGLTEEGGDDTSDLLLQVGIPIISTTSCQRQYSSAGVGINGTAMICGGFAAGGKDSCQGDSGGPFVFKGTSGYTLQGVVSFGVGCARPGLPGVYSRVSTYIDWINNKIATLSTVSG